MPFTRNEEVVVMVLEGSGSWYPVLTRVVTTLLGLCEMKVAPKRASVAPYGTPLRWASSRECAVPSQVP